MKYLKTSHQDLFQNIYHGHLKGTGKRATMTEQITNHKRQAIKTT